MILAFFVPPREIVSQERTPEVLAAQLPRSRRGEGEVLAWSWTEFGEDQRFTSHLRYEWQDEEHQTTRTLEHSLTARYLFPEEVPPLLERCGYEVTAVYGDFQRGPLEDDSTEQIWVAVPKP